MSARMKEAEARREEAVTHLLSPLLSRCDVHSSKNSEIVCEVDAVSVCSIPITTASGRYNSLLRLQLRVVTTSVYYTIHTFHYLRSGDLPRYMTLLHV